MSSSHGAGAQGTPADAPLGCTEADLRRLLAGDSEAFARLWLRFHPALALLLQARFRRALEPSMRIRLDAELEDILQNTAMTVLRQLPTFDYRGPGSLLAWMGAIAQKAANDRLDYWRAGKRTPAAMTRPLAPSSGDHTTQWIDGLPGREFGVLTQVHDAERRRQLAEVLVELPERFQTIVLWRFFAGAEWAEIAREVGSPSGEAVKMECALKVLPAIAAALRQSPDRSTSDG